jgi:RNA polymerase primary sigma factor
MTTSTTTTNAQNGGAKPQKVKKTGTRKQVMDGTALHTSGGLYKKDLKYNKQGKIVSVRQSLKGKEQQKHLGPWRAHLEKFRKANPNMSLKDAMKAASQTYKKGKKPAAKKTAAKKTTAKKSAPKKKAPAKKTKAKKSKK